MTSPWTVMPLRWLSTAVAARLTARRETLAHRVAPSGSRIARLVGDLGTSGAATAINRVRRISRPPGWLMPTPSRPSRGSRRRRHFSRRPARSATLLNGAGDPQRSPILSTRGCGGRWRSYTRPRQRRLRTGANSRNTFSRPPYVPRTSRIDWWSMLRGPPEKGGTGGPPSRGCADRGACHRAGRQGCGVRHQHRRHPPPPRDG
jgi:hypothetical protein